ncbi:MAG: hypothetical protein IJP75_07835, partial [Bacteroidaceae bacterium]|nr:hypothetical protein [Bacteroidaceae bacterium]
ADKGQTLVLYRKFFSGINDIEFKKLNDLKSVIRTEDRLFRTFLTHISQGLSCVDIILFSSSVLAALSVLVWVGAYRREAHEGNDVRLVSFVEVGSWRKWKGVLGCFRVF